MMINMCVSAWWKASPWYNSSLRIPHTWVRLRATCSAMMFLVEERLIDNAGEQKSIDNLTLSKGPMGSHQAND